MVHVSECTVNLNRLIAVTNNLGRIVLKKDYTSIQSTRPLTFDLNNTE